MNNMQKNFTNDTNDGKMQVDDIIHEFETVVLWSHYDDYYPGFCGKLKNVPNNIEVSVICQIDEQGVTIYLEGITEPIPIQSLDEAKIIKKQLSSVPELIVSGYQKVINWFDWNAEDKNIDILNHIGLNEHVISARVEYEKTGDLQIAFLYSNDHLIEQGSQITFYQLFTISTKNAVQFDMYKQVAKQNLVKASKMTRYKTRLS